MSESNGFMGSKSVAEHLSLTCCSRTTGTFIAKLILQKRRRSYKCYMSTKKLRDNKLIKENHQFFSAPALFSIIGKIFVSFCAQMREADDQCTYLGLPNIVGRNKSRILGFLKEKVRANLKSWDGKLVARSGKEVLVKSVVLQALPAYAMNVFLYLVKLRGTLEKVSLSFGGSLSKTLIHT